VKAAIKIFHFLKISCFWRWSFVFDVVEEEEEEEKEE
jgi:hypothetical protein